MSSHLLGHLSFTCDAVLTLQSGCHPASAYSVSTCSFHCPAVYSSLYGYFLPKAKEELPGMESQVIVPGLPDTFIIIRSMFMEMKIFLRKADGERGLQVVSVSDVAGCGNKCLLGHALRDCSHGSTNERTTHFGNSLQVPMDATEAEERSCTVTDCGGNDACVPHLSNIHSTVRPCSPVF